MVDYTKNGIDISTTANSGGGVLSSPGSFLSPNNGGQSAGDEHLPGVVGESLGTTAKFVTPPPLDAIHSRRVHRFYLQSIARRVLISERSERVSGDVGGRTYSNPRYRVCECLRVTHNRKDAVAIDYSTRNKSAHYANLRVCGSLWQCPVCAAKISEARRIELHSLVERARGEGCSTFMVTYTLAHHRGDLLGDLLAKLNDARRAGKMGRSYTEFTKKHQIIGSVRSVELTYGANGWHPHAHELMISAVSPGTLHYGEITEYLKRRWELQAGKFGFDASWEHGLDVGFIEGRVDDYLAKFGRETYWDESHELAKQVSKVARSAGGVTPFGLLDAHGAGEQVFGQSPARLFLEYVQAFFGKKQLFWSAGLRARFGLGAEVDDSELAEALPDDRKLAALVDLVDWSMVTRYEHRAHLLNIIEAADGNPAGIVEFINHLREQHLGKV